MPLPKGHSPLLFFQLASVPAKDPDASATGDADTLQSSGDAILYLAVATLSVDLVNMFVRMLTLRSSPRRIIYLFESRPCDRRTWVQCNEFYVRAPFPLPHSDFSEHRYLSWNTGTFDSPLPILRPDRPFSSRDISAAQTLLNDLGVLSNLHTAQSVKPLHLPRNATRIGPYSPL